MTYQVMMSQLLVGKESWSFPGWCFLKQFCIFSSLRSLDELTQRVSRCLVCVALF